VRAGKNIAPANRASACFEARELTIVIIIKNYHIWLLEKIHTNARAQAR
jgi:hypothetical protein